MEEHPSVISIVKALWTSELPAPALCHQALESIRRRGRKRRRKGRRRNTSYTAPVLRVQPRFGFPPHSSVCNVPAAPSVSTTRSAEQQHSLHPPLPTSSGSRRWLSAHGTCNEPVRRPHGDRTPLIALLLLYGERTAGPRGLPRATH